MTTVPVCYKYSLLHDLMMASAALPAFPQSPRNPEFRFRVDCSRSKLYYPNDRFGSLADLLTDSSLTAALAWKPDAEQPGFVAFRLDVRFSPKRTLLPR